MMPARRGMSLISLMVVITILSGLLLMVGTLLRGLLVAETATADRVSQLRQWEQLIVQFRRDVHAATGAEIFVSAQPIGQELQLTTPGGRIDYVVREGCSNAISPRRRDTTSGVFPISRPKSARMPKLASSRSV